MATNHLKKKEYSRKSLCKGKSLTGTEALNMLVSKRCKEADEVLKRAKRAIQVYENKRKGELKAQGIQAQRDKKARLARLKEIAPQGFIPLGIQVPPKLLCPIRDPEKQPLPNEVQALATTLISIKYFFKLNSSII